MEGISCQMFHFARCGFIDRCTLPARLTDTFVANAWRDADVQASEELWRAEQAPLTGTIGFRIDQKIVVAGKAGAVRGQPCRLTHWHLGGRARCPNTERNGKFEQPSTWPQRCASNRDGRLRHIRRALFSASLDSAREPRKKHGTLGQDGRSAETFLGRLKRISDVGGWSRWR
jgi:hypothetical protein